MPTDKELLNAYAHGIVSAARANWMTLANMDAYFWSASYYSQNSPNAWFVNLGLGNTAIYDKNVFNSVVCVR